MKTCTYVLWYARGYLCVMACATRQCYCLFCCCSCWGGNHQLSSLQPSMLLLKMLLLKLCCPSYTQLSVYTLVFLSLFIIIFIVTTIIPVVVLITSHVNTVTFYSWCHYRFFIFETDIIVDLFSLILFR